MLRMLNGSSACEPDGIHPSILKACSEVVAWPLYIIFRKSLDTGMMRQLWKTITYSPTQGGSQSDPFIDP